jgi:hypothetical protein
MINDKQLRCIRFSAGLACRGWVFFAVRPGQDSGCEVYGAIEGADAETEPASPASTSIRSVTTAQASPQSLVSGSGSGGIQGRGHSMPSSALFPLPTVRELQGGEQEVR